MDKTQKRLEDRLAYLVSEPTETSNTLACTNLLKEIASEFKALGYFTKVHPSKHAWLTATSKQTKKPKLLFAAHLDVVPATDPSQYKMRSTAQKLYGRGVFDMKSGIACMLELAHTIAPNLKQYDVGFLITSDEEFNGLYGTAAAMEDGWSADIAFLADGGRDWKIERRAKGRYSCDLIATGKEAHASRPWDGENAMLKLLPALHKINKKFKNKSPLKLTAAVTAVSAGMAPNQISGEARAHIDIRSFSKKDAAVAMESLNKLAQKHKLSFVVDDARTPIELKLDNPYVQSFLTCYENTLRKKPEFTDSFGSSDAYWLGTKDIPCILVQTRGGGSHGPDEWIMRKDLVKFYGLMLNYTNRVAHVTSDNLTQSGVDDMMQESSTT